MNRLFFIYPNKYFLDFIKKFLSHYQFEVESATDGVSGYNQANKYVPDLLIINKVLPSIDLDGFFVKKKVTPILKDIPSFLVGDFSSTEVMKLKQYHVMGFISHPINPFSVLERLNQHFKVRKQEEKKTPMMVDLHAKGNIIVVQIEGNFEPAKLEILNYRLRTFWLKKKIEKPKVLLIFPNIYPESITPENIEVLFGFLDYPEFRFTGKSVMYLTNNQKITEVIEANEVYKVYGKAPNYYEGMQTLNTDFDKNNIIPVEYLKVGASYIFDLYDDEGDVRIPALSVITEDVKAYFLRYGLRKLMYYSDKPIDEIMANQNSNISDGQFKQFEFLLSETIDMDGETDEISVVNEKVNLFLTRLRGQKALVISGNTFNNETIHKALNQYMSVDVLDPASTVSLNVEYQKYILIFIDHAAVNPPATEILQRIRLKSDRRNTSVVIVSKSINKEQLAVYKKIGTDYVILEPLNPVKIQYKVFSSIHSDRKTDQP